MTNLSVPQNCLPDPSAKRVLLINPAVYDTRLHWAHWQQPTYLLRLTSYFAHLPTEVKLVDLLHTSTSTRITRKRIEIINVDSEAVPRWRYGVEEAVFRRQIESWRDDGWYPEDVYIEAFATIWWEGAAEASRIVKQTFPDCRVIMLGGYPSYAPDHATTRGGADVAVSEFWPEVASLPADVSLYATPPRFLYISTSHGQRPVADVVREIVGHVGRGVKQFAFIDHEIARQHTDLYVTVLEHLARHHLSVKFASVGNIAPADLVERPHLAGLMRSAGYTQIFFSDDRRPLGGDCAGEQLVEDYRIAAEHCHRAGFPKRTGDICASVSVGRPHENIGERTRIATSAAHHAGSVIFWPYQPTPQECPNLSLEHANGKLFPFRHDNGYSYRDYLNLMGLGVVLNSKYRNETFDFLGDGFVARLLRDSIAREGWNPDPSVKGSLRVLPVQRN